MCETSSPVGIRLGKLSGSPGVLKESLRIQAGSLAEDGSPVAAAVILPEYRPAESEEGCSHNSAHFEEYGAGLMPLGCFVNIESANVKSVVGEAKIRSCFLGEIERDETSVKFDLPLSGDYLMPYAVILHNSYRPADFIRFCVDLLLFVSTRNRTVIAYKGPSSPQPQLISDSQ